jgi:hypothetical protein
MLGLGEWSWGGYRPHGRRRRRSLGGGDMCRRMLRGELMLRQRTGRGAWRLGSAGDA